MTTRRQCERRFLCVSLLVSLLWNFMLVMTRTPGLAEDVSSSPSSLERINNSKDGQVPLVVPPSRVEIPHTLNTDLPNCTRVTMNPYQEENIFVPIFMMTRDRLSSTQTTIESYRSTLSRSSNSNFKIIVIDHNSTYPPMLDYLRRQEKDYDVKVHHVGEVSWDMAMNITNGIIQAYLVQHPEIKYYVFTDPDIALVRTHPDVLLFYAALLEACPWLNVVGPHLQISDIPDHYQRKYLKNHSAYDWEAQFWKTVPNMATWKGSGYHISEQLIDTTFGMRRRDLTLGRITCPCIRAYAPYAAVHVDWYHDTANPPPDKQYYLKRQRGVNNW